MTKSVLVTYASKYNATAEIAEAVGAALSEHGLHVTVLPVEGAGDPGEYDAVVIGSAVYAGHWLKPAREFVDQHRESFTSRSVWLFSSGPVGDPPKPEEMPVDVEEMMAATGAREHRIFAGKIDKSRMNFAEKALTMALRVPEGDYRNWDDIKEWSATIAGEITPAEMAQ